MRMKMDLKERKDEEETKKTRPSQAAHRIASNLIY